MDGIELRRMTAADAAGVALLEKRIFAHPWSEADFIYEMEQNPVARYLVATRGGALVGFAGAHVILDEGHVTNVAVAPEERGRGAGRALMQGLMQYASNLGARYLTLEVRASNATAIALYTRLGFLRVSVRKKYYGDNGEDALLMVCDRLPPAQDGFAEAETVFL